MSEMKRGKPEKKISKGVLAGIIAGACVLALCAGAVGGALWVRKQETVFPNVYVAGVNLGGMTEAEATAAIEETGITRQAEVTACVKIGDLAEITIDAENAGYAVEAEDIAALAMKSGRKNGLFANAMSYLLCLGNATEIDPKGFENYREDEVRTALQAALAEFSDVAVDAAYTLTEDSVSLTKGITGVTVNEDEILELVRQQFETGDYTPVTYEPDTETAHEISLQEIYDRIYVEPADAAYSGGVDNITPEVVGVSFDLSAAQEAYNALREGESLTVPIVYTQPEVTRENIADSLFHDVLWECTTSVATSTENRITNITLAAEAYNGTVLQPGELFSYNETVGERTWERGFREAGAYAGGQSVSQIGGGICQTSSTLYVCVLHADLEVVERQNHGFVIGYLPLGEDATVDWGNVDLKFRNNRNFPIRIEAGVEDMELTVRLMGTNENDYTIELEHATESYTPFQTVKQEDPSVTEGEKEKVSGYNGAVVSTVMKIYDGDGNLVESRFISRDVYNKRDRVLLVPVGTLNPTTSPSAAPADAPAATPAPEATPAPAAEATPAPAAEATPAPTAEPTPAPTAEPTPAPTAEPTPAPTPEPAPEPTPVPEG